MSVPRRKPGITAAQKALLHVAAQRLGLDDDTYRDMLQSVAGVRSSNDLGPRDFDRVMQHLTERGFEKTYGAHDYAGYMTRLKYWQTLAGNRPGMATPAQIARLETDWDLLRWYWAPKGFANRELALRAFLRRVTKSEDLRFLTFSRAKQAITAMKKIEQRRDIHPAPPESGATITSVAPPLREKVLYK